MALETSKIWIEMTYQLRQSYNIQSLKELSVNLIHPRRPVTKKLLNYLSDLAASNGESSPLSLYFASSNNSVVARLSRCSKYSFHHPTI